MAIGITNQLGYWLPDNFNYPYRAVSIIDFWRRWHISLSNWLRDYLYISLGGNRGSRLFQYRNLLLTMLLGGLWHGASWNFILWGALHGAALVAAHAWRTHQATAAIRRERPPFAPGAGRIVIAWTATQFFVLLCWIPFRAENFPQALEAFRAVLWLRPDAGLAHAPIPWLLLLVPVAVDTFLVGNPSLKKIITNPWAGYATMALAFLVALLFMFIGNKPFIYFQF
jgi:alginate O-acetyltransferase complex protein AlgI